MAPLTSTQKAAVTQFVNFTQADKKVAERTLRSHNWNTQQAVDSYFASGASKPTNGAGSDSKEVATLSKLFDKYRDRDDARSPDSPDTISISAMSIYLEDLGVSLEDIALLIVSEVVQSPTLGEMNRQGFIAGWLALNATSVAAQKSVLKGLTDEVQRPDAAADREGRFRKIYRHTFKLACPPGSKNIPLEMAIEYWRLLFGAKGLDWGGVAGKGSRKNQQKWTSPWLDWWLEFLEQKWKKAVNKDLWDQTLLFMEKTREDESMSWWSEEAAWPGVIDDFVEKAKERRREAGLPAGTQDGGEAMEVD